MTLEKSQFSLLTIIVCIILLSAYVACSAIDESLAKSEVDIADKKATTVLYISNKGNDQWSGTLALPNSAGNDGPFATLQRARDAIRVRKATNQGKFMVLVRGGVYRLDKPLTLGPEDSGTETNPVIFRAYDNERPVLSGAKTIDNFKAYKAHIFKADVKELSLASSNIRQLFSDGKRQTLARFPNYDRSDPIGSGFLYVENPIEAGSKVKFKYGEGSVRDWANPNNAEIVIYPGPNYWNNTIPIDKINRAQRIITLAENASYAIEQGNRYFFQNLLEELDSPGEWYYDQREKVLYFWPANEGSLRTASVPVLKSIIEIKEKVYYNKYRRAPAHIRFEGFTLEECIGSAIVLSGAKNITISRCTIFNAGGNGIEIEGGRQNAAFGNDIYEVGSVGILVSGGDEKTLSPGDNRAENNYIHHIGIFRKTSSGIDCRGVGNVISHNLVHSSPRIGILFEGNDHIIEYNHVHHVNQETQDSGAIYSCARDWTKRGNVIRFNYVHHSGGYGRKNAAEVWQAPFYTWGIYLDDWSSGTHVFGNIITHTSDGGIFIHGGRDNVVENNVIIEGGKAQMVYSSQKNTARELPGMFAKIKEIGYTKYPLLSSITDAKQGATMSGNKFVHNIIYYTSKSSILYDISGILDLATTTSDYNIIYNANLPLLIPYMKGTPNIQWKSWRESGLDQNSVLADPLFEDLTGGKFRLAPLSPALQKGFQPIPSEKMGPYKDPLRASWPIKE